MIDFQSQLYLSENSLLEELIDERVIAPNVEVLTRYLVISVGALFFSLLLDIYTNGEDENEDDGEDSETLAQCSEDSKIQKGNRKQQRLFHKQFKWKSRIRDVQLQKAKTINHSESNEDGTRQDCGAGEGGDYRQMKINEETDPHSEQHRDDDNSGGKNRINFADDEQKLLGEITKAEVSS